MQAGRIYETCLCCDDLATTSRFCAEVLGLERISEFLPRGMVFRCGEGVLILFNRAETTQTTKLECEQQIPPHGTTGVGHLAFLATAEELVHWRAQLQQYGVSIISEVKWEMGGTSVYFHDPAGNLVELAPPRLWKVV